MPGPNDYHKVLKDAVSVEDLKRAKTAFWKKMRTFAGRVPFARQAAALYYMIRDPNVELPIKATAVLAILYFISPVDMIPDVIPITGFLDDAGVIATAVSVLGPKIAPYLQFADAWIQRGRPMSDDDGASDEEVIREVEVTQGVS
ncbi:MAG: DUF1232 domain-containing protein [Planctomycetes bacterium]|nr:DUF1232 domain-containing protein [Planctomycetota bacterium]